MVFDKYNDPVANSMRIMLSKKIFCLRRPNMANVPIHSLKQIKIVLIVFIISFSLCVCSVASEGPLRAGTAKIDITPGKPIKMAGYSARTALSKDVHDPLSARVVAFENNGKRLILVSSDLIGYYNGTAEQIRKVVLSEFNLKPGELFLSAIHTHDGPNLTMDKEKGHPNNVEYTKELEGKLIEVIHKAMDNTGPVQIGTGVGYCPIGMNRRELVFDRSGNSQIKLGCNPYGPTDKQVLVLKIARPDGTAVASLFDYATHATCLGGKNLTVSGDVIGLAEQFVEKILGGEIIAPAFAGASGNIDPWFRVLPGFNNEPGWIPEPVLLGTFLGEEVVHVYRDIDTLSDGGDIRISFVNIELPGKERGGTEIKKDFPPTLYNITVAKVGHIAFVGLGGEVLTEIGMSIKAASPFKHTFVITHCNGAAGYLPPEHLYVEGGYEIRSSPFAPKAANMVVTQAVKMLHEL
jgi:neutral ceramidase